MHHPNGSPPTGPVTDRTGDEAGRLDPYERVALSIYTSTFHDDDQPSLNQPANLRYDEPVAAVRSRLARLGYRVTTVDDQPADMIAAAAARWFAETARPGVLRIVHVLSHGLRGGQSRHVRVAGRYGTHTSDTALVRWLEKAADDGNGARTLFVADLCPAGELAIQSWDQLLDAAERVAWVVAATAPDAPAFNARLTQALATTVDRIARRRLTSRDPDADAVDLGTIVRHLQAQVLQLPPLGVGQSAALSGRGRRTHRPSSSHRPGSVVARWRGGRRAQLFHRPWRAGPPVDPGTQICTGRSPWARSRARWAGARSLMLMVLMFTFTAVKGRRSEQQRSAVLPQPWPCRFWLHF